MIRTTAHWTLALLVAFAANAFAADGKEDRASGTVSLWGSDGVVVGARFQLNVPLGHGHHWTISPALGYGYGYGKTDYSLPYAPFFLYVQGHELELGRVARPSVLERR
jgi:hypothetical protein